MLRTAYFHGHTTTVQMPKKTLRVRAPWGYEITFRPGRPRARAYNLHLWQAAYMASQGNCSSSTRKIVHSQGKSKSLHVAMNRSALDHDFFRSDWTGDRRTEHGHSDLEHHHAKLRALLSGRNRDKFEQIELIFSDDEQ